MLITHEEYRNLNDCSWPIAPVVVRYNRLSALPEKLAIRKSGSNVALGRELPVTFTKPCEHERHISGFSIFDRLEEKFVFSSTVNTFFGLIKF